MKFLIAFLLVYSSIAFGAPRVGDYAKYSLTFRNNGREIQGYREVTITNFDSVRKLWTIKTVNSFEGNPPSGTIVLAPPEYFYTDVGLQEMLSKCSSYGFISEVVQLPMGDVTTCKVDFFDSSTGKLSSSVSVGPVVLQKVKFYDSLNGAEEFGEFIEGRNGQ